MQHIFDRPTFTQFCQRAWETRLERQDLHGHIDLGLGTGPYNGVRRYSTDPIETTKGLHSIESTEACVVASE